MINFTGGFPKQASARLKEHYIVWLTTVDSDNVPQPRPVWFHWDGSTLLVFSQPQAAKLRHIARNPSVSVHLNSDAEGAEVTVLVGTAKVLPRWPKGKRTAEYLKKYQDGINGLGYTSESFAAEYTTPIEITPTAVRGF
jgi:PPOX class probable F420-dependent enzyme